MDRVRTTIIRRRCRCELSVVERIEKNVEEEPSKIMVRECEENRKGKVG